MIQIRPSEARGRTHMRWLESYHSFSFGHYHDPAHMGFRHLRVINDDYFAPGGGFGMHPHQDMEIVTYVLDGELEHRDSLGNGSIIRPGDVQRMTAGTGIMHSEFNPSDERPVHLLQIWILPDKRGLKPTYEQQHFENDEIRGKLRVVAFRDGQKNGAVTINQDVRIYASLLNAEDSVSHELSTDRHAWLQVARGSVVLNDKSLKSGDGAAISEERLLQIESLEESEILLFDLA